MAEDNDFCLVSLNILNDFGQQMLEIKNLELTSETKNSNLLDKPQSLRDVNNEDDIDKEDEDDVALRTLTVNATDEDGDELTL